MPHIYVGDSYRQNMKLESFTKAAPNDPEVREVYFQMFRLMRRLEELRERCKHPNKRNDTEDYVRRANVAAGGWPGDKDTGPGIEIRKNYCYFSCPDCGRHWMERSAILFTELNKPDTSTLLERRLEDDAK